MNLVRLSGKATAEKEWKKEGQYLISGNSQSLKADGRRGVLLKQVT